MTCYYKVPIKIEYVTEYDEEGNATVTDQIAAIKPDIPEGTPFIGSKIDDTHYIVKVCTAINGELLNPEAVPECIKNSNVGG